MAAQGLSASEVLEQFLPTVENLPSEIRFLCSELLSMNPELQSVEAGVKSTDTALRKMIKTMPAGQIGDPDPVVAAAVGDDKQSMDVDEAQNNEPSSSVAAPLLTEQERLEKESNDAKAQLLAATRQETMSMIKDDAEQIKLYEKVHENQLYCIEMQDKRLNMIARARESLEKHIKRVNIELEQLEDGDPSLGLQTSVSGSAHSVSSYTEAPRKVASTLAASSGRGWETPIVAAGSSQKRAVGTSNLKNVISIKKSQKRKIGDVVGSGATGAAVAAVAVDPDERHYCICNAVSYGEMVACDGKTCPYEWFHYDCVGLTEPPKGLWFCDHCTKTK